MQNLWWLLLVLACPLMMIFMMRGMVGGHGGHTSPPAGSAVPGADERDRRIAELERENVALRKQVPGARAGHAAHDAVGHEPAGRDGASG